MNKKTTKAKKQIAPAQAGLATFRPCKTIEEITNQFVAARRQGKRSNGENDHLQDFLNIAQLIGTQYLNQTFSFNDFLSLPRHLDTPAEVLAEHFHAWIAELDANGRIRTMHGAYNYPVHAFK